MSSYNVLVLSDKNWFICSLERVDINGWQGGSPRKNNCLKKNLPGIDSLRGMGGSVSNIQTCSRSFSFWVDKSILEASEWSESNS